MQHLFRKDIALRPTHPRIQLDPSAEPAESNLSPPSHLNTLAAYLVDGQLPRHSVSRTDQPHHSTPVTTYLDHRRPQPPTQAYSAEYVCLRNENDEGFASNPLRYGFRGMSMEQGATAARLQACTSIPAAGLRTDQQSTPPCYPGVKTRENYNTPIALPPRGVNHHSHGSQ